MESASPYKKGDIVKAGTPIGKVGNTGHSTGNHLHFEVRDKNGAALDPLTGQPPSGKLVPLSPEDLNAVGAQVAATDAAMELFGDGGAAGDYVQSDYCMTGVSPSSYVEGCNAEVAVKNAQEEAAALERGETPSAAAAGQRPTAAAALAPGQRPTTAAAAAQAAASGQRTPAAGTTAGASPAGQAAASRQPTNPAASPAGQAAASRQPTNPGASPAGQAAASRQPTNPAASPAGQAAASRLGIPAAAQAEAAALLGGVPVPTLPASSTGE